MRRTAEVRFFGRAPIAAFESWFEGIVVERRNDIYAMSQKADVGIKQRGDVVGVEIKALVDEDAMRVRVGGREARVQIWTKVTSESLSLPIDQLVVKKARRVRLYDGCQVEYTTLEVTGDAWWTFGLEATDLARLTQTLAVLEVPPLGHDWRERSYPEWLVTLPGEGLRKSGRPRD